MTPNDQQVQDIGIPDEKVTKILDSLDDAEVSVTESARRSLRSPLRGTAVMAFVDEADSEPVTYRVRLRNISLEGVAFLIGRPLYPGVDITIELPIGPGLSLVKRRGVVRRYRLVEEPIHEIGVEFLSDTPPKR
jgi:hypothetical protein